MSIIMNFNNARTQAGSLETLASDLRSISRNGLEDSLTSIRQYWKGENAESFLKKGDQLKDKITSIADELEQTAEVIRQIAKKTYDTEMAAIEIANKSK